MLFVLATYSSSPAINSLGSTPRASASLRPLLRSKDIKGPSQNALEGRKYFRLIAQTIEATYFDALVHVATRQVLWEASEVMSEYSYPYLTHIARPPEERRWMRSWHRSCLCPPCDHATSWKRCIRSSTGFWLRVGIYRAASTAAASSPTLRPLFVGGAGGASRARTRSSATAVAGRTIITII